MHLFSVRKCVMLWKRCVITLQNVWMETNTGKYLHTCIYVTGFGKMCIAHTSNFSTLLIHKIYRKWQIVLKLSGNVEPLFSSCVPFSVVFMDLQMSKIELCTFFQICSHTAMYVAKVTWSVYICKHVNVAMYVDHL